MINFNQEYFGNNCYFYLKDKGDSFSLYYSVAENLVESRKKDEKKDFPKKKLNSVKRMMKKNLTSKTKVSKKELDKDVENIEKNEIDELVDSDGTMLSSRVPNLNMYLHPKKTMDQTVVAARISNDPVTRGYRVYYGESEEKDGDVVNEIDYSDAFGYEETKDMDFKDSVLTLSGMGVDNPVERTMSFGKIKNEKVKKDKKGRKVLKQRITEKESLEEMQRKRMMKMVEDILSKKTKDNSDVVSKKETPISKLLEKNLKAIKNLADKEGVSISKLINILKSDE